MLKLVVPLDRVSLKVYGGDVDHGCIRSLVEAKISFSARDPPGWVSIFPSKEVHPHAWVLLLTSQEHRSAYGAGGNKRRKKDNSGSDLQLEGCGLRVAAVTRVLVVAVTRRVAAVVTEEDDNGNNRKQQQQPRRRQRQQPKKMAETATEEDGSGSNRKMTAVATEEDSSGSNRRRWQRQ
ncbi:hypothetical protein BHE74_00039174 [Ensete ventricosum]|nr:hypothetical protein BHE74_00039174 [Ensete ventricosum]